LQTLEPRVIHRSDDLVCARRFPLMATLHDYVLLFFGHKIASMKTPQQLSRKAIDEFGEELSLKFS